MTSVDCLLVRGKKRSKPSPATLHDLPEEVLLKCMEYVGIGFFRYIGPSCKELLKAYTYFGKYFHESNCNPIYETSWEAIVSSQSCHQLYLAEQFSVFQRNCDTSKICTSMFSMMVAAGRTDKTYILEWAREFWKRSGSLPLKNKEMCWQQTALAAVRMEQKEIMHWLIDNDL